MLNYNKTMQLNGITEGLLLYKLGLIAMHRAAGGGGNWDILRHARNIPVKPLGLDAYIQTFLFPHIFFFVPLLNLFVAQS